MEVKRRIELFIKKNGFKPTAEMTCPHFELCDKSKCPLHKNFTKLEDTPGDHIKCKVSKTIRKEIGLYFKLKNMGLTLRELASMKLSIKMKQQVLTTRDKNLKTSKNSPVIPNSKVICSKQKLSQIAPANSIGASNLNKYLEVKK